MKLYAYSLSTIKLIKAFDVSNVLKKQIYGVGTIYKANGNDSLALIIPKTVNEKLGIEKGTRFLISTEEGNIVLSRA